MKNSENNNLIFEFNAETNSYAVVGCEEGVTDIVIPRLYNDGVNGTRNVTIIKERAFNNSFIKSVSIPNSIQEIGELAFANNEIASVVIPDGIKVISNGVFANNKLTSVIIPEGVEIIDRWAFSGNKLTNIVIAESVEKIKDLAFYDNPNIENIVLPPTVLEVDHGAFLKCSEEAQKAYEEWKELEIMRNFVLGK